nr:phosphoribosyltransferase family protein [Candidatus Sigynarchaeota archaeon]
MSPEAQPGQQRRYLSWEEFTKLEAVLVGKLAGCVRANGIKRFDLVIGIFRGGMIVARSIASKLGNVPLAIVKVIPGNPPRLDWMGEAACLEDLNAQESKANVLLVDDISDSGVTFSTVMNLASCMHFNKIITASLVLRASSSFVPDCHAETEQTERWIVFPWE